jgi:hypothetical protein
MEKQHLESTLATVYSLLEAESMTEEIVMRLITRFELAGKTDEELQSLLSQSFNAAASSNHNHKRNVITFMKNIQNEILSRSLCP